MSAQRFRKRPGIIEAMQRDGTRARDFEIGEWMRASEPLSDWYGGYCEMAAAPDGWIIRDVDGVFYPYRADAFETSYEPAPIPEGQP
jgi:hypothetical protein